MASTGAPNSSSSFGTSSMKLRSQDKKCNKHENDKQNKISTRKRKSTEKHDNTHHISSIQKPKQTNKNNRYSDTSNSKVKMNDEGLIWSPLIPFEFNGSHNKANMTWRSPDQIKRDQIALELASLAIDRGFTVHHSFLDQYGDDEGKTIKNSQLTLEFHQPGKIKTNITICSQVIPTFPLHDSKQDLQMFIMKNGKITKTIANEQSLFAEYDNMLSSKTVLS